MAEVVLHMDESMCVVHLFYMRVHAWFGLMLCMSFAFAHVCHTCVLFKLWVILLYNAKNGWLGSLSKIYSYL